MKSFAGLGQSTVIDIAKSYGSEYLKKEASGLLAEIAIDAGASFLPGVSGAVQAYKRKRLEENMLKAIEETISRIKDIEKNLQFKSEEQRNQIDELFGYVLDFISDEPQVDKIKYFINGFVNLTSHESITEDFVLTYYDLMSNLRMVDLAVLRIYYRSIYYDQQNHETYIDVMDEYGITQEQYDSVRNNLFRLGLLTTKKDVENMNDLDSLFESIKTIHKYLTMVGKGKIKSLPKLKDPKMRSKERFQTSKFGRQFHVFFMEEQE